jgi:integrase
LTSVTISKIWRCARREWPYGHAAEPLDDKALGHAARGFTDKNIKVVRQGICKFLGMQPWTPHDLRRTSASLARGLGIPKWKISQCLDHRSRDEEESPVVTDVYVHSEYGGEKNEVLDAVARALREIIGLPPATQQPAVKLVG